MNKQMMKVGTNWNPPNYNSPTVCDISFICHEQDEMTLTELTLSSVDTRLTVSHASDLKR